jgi:hypothetical protein
MPELDDEREPVFEPRREAARHVLKRKQEWWDSMRPRRSAWAREDKRYHNFRDDLAVLDAGEGQTQPRANIGVPLAAETVDTAVARSHDNLLGRLPYGRVVGREPSDQLKSDIVQQVVNYQQQASEFPIAAHRIFRDCYKYGVGFGKMHFKKEMRRVPEPVEILGIPVGMRKVDRIVSETPILEHVHIQDIFFPMDAPSIQAAEGIIHRTWEDKQRMRDAKDGLGQPLYSLEAIDRLKDTSTMTSAKDSDAELSTEYTTRKINTGGLHKDNKHPVLEYTGKLPIDIAQKLVERFYPDDDPRADWIVTVVDGSDEPLRVEPSPYLTNERMFIAAKVIDDPGYIAGISLIEFVEKLGLTIDELYNIMLDNLNLIINKVVYINEFAGIDESDVVMAPGKIIRGTRPPKEAIDVIQFPDLSQSTFLLINMLLSHYKEYTGITNPVLGQSEAGRQTATEIASIVQHSSTRLGQFERMLEDTFMRPVFERWVLLNQQFIDQEFVIRIFKDSQPLYPKVAPEDIQGLFDYIFEGSTRAESQALMAGQILQALQVNATQPVPVFNPLKLGEQLLVTFGWKNVGDFLNPEYLEQYQLFQQLQALKNVGETAKALTPEQQMKTSNGNAANQGAAAQPDNIPTTARAIIANTKENALPPLPEEA